MSLGLSFGVLPIYCYSSFRYFEAHEKHMMRVCSQDVLVMVFGGVLRFHENGVPIEVGAGEYYIQRRGNRHEGVEESDMPKYYFIHFRGEFTADANTLPLRGKADFEELMPLFQQLDLRWHSGAPAVEKAAVFFQILSILRKNNDRTEKSAVVLKVISMASRNIRKPFSLDEVAKACGYSKNHVINVFKRETGKTPYAYVTDMKLDMAKQLLLNSESSLAQIAIESGFGDYINLYKAFVKAQGEPPLSWKQRTLTGK